MKGKKRRRQEDAAIRASLARPPLTFDILTICWRDRTVEYQGRTITAGPEDCLAIPILNARAWALP